MRLRMMCVLFWTLVPEFQRGLSVWEPGTGFLFVPFIGSCRWSLIEGHATVKKKAGVPVGILNLVFT